MADEKKLPTSGPKPRRPTWDPGAPTHNLCVKIDGGRKNTKGNDFFRQVGVGWMNEKGQVKIKLEPATVLRWDDGLTIHLFKNEKKGSRDGS
jgi:hypothetical protein